MSERYAVIMAGGKGERLRPLSTDERPKQFLPLLNDRTMLQETVDRIAPLFPLDNVNVVTGREYVRLVSEQLPKLPSNNIIVEPMGRGTAPCIGLAAILLHQVDPRAVMAVLPADHVIKDEERYLMILSAAIDTAEEGTHLLTLGINPDRPATSYGYIHAGEPYTKTRARESLSIFYVARFTEKPDMETAKRFLMEEKYFWNSGMFISRVDRILAEIKAHMPRLYAGLEEIRASIGSSGYDDAVQSVFEDQEKLSIDYGVMEKSQNVLVMPVEDIGWSDVGNWEALREAIQLRNKPWGYEELWALTRDYAGKLLFIRAGESLSLQYHEKKDETIYIQSGRLLLSHGENQDLLTCTVLRPGEHFHIPPGLMHRIEAKEDCYIIQVSTPHLVDVVRLEARYGRV